MPFGHRDQLIGGAPIQLKSIEGPRIGLWGLYRNPRTPEPTGFVSGSTARWQIIRAGLNRLKLGPNCADRALAP